MKLGISLLASLALMIGTLGCSNSSQPTETAQKGEGHSHEEGHEHHHHEGEGGKVPEPVAPSADGQQYVMASEPDGVMNVIEARENVKNDDEVVLFGHIGGSGNPWIEGQAMFTIVDESLKSCDEIPGDNCPKPWDYCCATDKLPTSTALVKVVDQDGNPIKKDARELLGVRELTPVVVKGKAQRDESGNLTVLATGLHVRK